MITFSPLQYGYAIHLLIQLIRFCFYYNFGVSILIDFIYFYLLIIWTINRVPKIRAVPFMRCLSYPLSLVFSILSSSISYRQPIPLLSGLCFVYCILHKLAMCKMPHFPFLLTQNVYFYVAILNVFSCLFLTIFRVHEVAWGPNLVQCLFL